MRLTICEGCWIIVSADRDRCPNDPGGLGQHPGHPLVGYESRPTDKWTRAQTAAAVSAVEAAESCLAVVKAALR